MRVLALTIAALAATALAPSRQVYRASTDAVVLDVAVFDGDRVVTSLGVDDFEVFDNGVRQPIETVDFNVLPIDLRLVFDVSGSISDEHLAWYVSAMRQATAALAPRDRCEIMTFNARIADAASRQRPPVTINLRRGGPDGTSFFDAVSLAMVTLPAVDRRQMAIVLSDARDTTSIFDEPTVLDMARRTDTVAFTILPGPSSAIRGVSISRLQAIAVLTGGRLIHAPHESVVGDAVVTALEEFRHSYVVRYLLTGVPLDGWHKVSVKVRGGHRVRTKVGYFGR